jgi:DNA helicase IV
VFYDPLQDIYGVGPHLRERFGQPYPITLNCRNTVSICDFFRATLPDQLQDLEPVPEALQGQKPRVIAYKDPDDERRRMETLIGELMGDHGLKPQQIMLLSPYTRPKTCLADVEGLCGCKLVDYEKRYSTRGGRTLFYETVMSFKGLDAAVVILHDVKPGDFATDPKMLYVAFSRARVALFVFKDRQIKLPSEAA